MVKQHGSHLAFRQNCFPRRVQPRPTEHFYNYLQATRGSWQTMTVTVTQRAVQRASPLWSCKQRAVPLLWVPGWEVKVGLQYQTPVLYCSVGTRRAFLAAGGGPSERCRAGSSVSGRAGQRSDKGWTGEWASVDRHHDGKTGRAGGWVLFSTTALPRRRLCHGGAAAPYFSACMAPLNRRTLQATMLPTARHG